MTKLIIVTLLAFTALVAFASAHRPIVTTTTTTLIEELGSSVFSKQQCSQQVQGQRFDQCQSYISNNDNWKENHKCCNFFQDRCLRFCMINSEDQRLGLEGCCNELKNVEEECQCEAMQQVYRQAQLQPQWSQQSSARQDLQQIVQNLHKQCNLQVQQCRIPYAAMF